MPNENELQPSDSRTIHYIPAHRRGKAGHKPKTPHPWRQARPDIPELASEDYDPRFDRIFGDVVQHVRNGVALTPKGAALLARFDSATASR